MGMKLFEVGAYRSDFLFVEMDEGPGLQRKSKHKRPMVARIMHSAALIKQERQDDLRRATRSVAKRVEKFIEVDGWIFEHLL
jgi:hypothetical protein